MRLVGASSNENGIIGKNGNKLNQSMRPVSGNKSGKNSGNKSGNHITLVPASGTRKAPLFQHSPQMWRTQNEYRGKNGKEIGNASGNKFGKTLPRHTSPNCPPGPCPPITTRLARVNNEFSTSHRRNKDE